MKIYQNVSSGVSALFACPASPLTKFAKVNSVLTALASQTETSVTFGTAPASGTSVEIFYGPKIVIPPGTYTVTGNGVALPPPALGNSLTLFLNITAASGTTPTLAVKLQCFDQVSAAWFDVPGASFAVATGVSTQTLTLFPGAAVVANVSVNQSLSSSYRAAYTIGGTTPSFTFSIGSQA